MQPIRRSTVESATMEALVESIVQSDTRAELTATQLEALIGLYTSTSAVLSPSHALFYKLSATLAALTAENALQCIQLCFFLCREAPHCNIIFELLEAHSARVDSIATPCISALATSRVARRSSNVHEAGKDLSFLSQLVLVMLTSAEPRMKATDLVEFIDADVESTVEVLVYSYGSVCGALLGVSAATSGLYQLHLATLLVQLFRELTFWTTYEELHSSLGIGSKAKRALSSCTASASMSVLSGPFHHHVGQLISHLVAYDLFGPMSMYLPRIIDRHLASPSSSSSDSDGGSMAMALFLLRSHLLLLQTLLTLTDQYTLVLRKALCRCGLLSKVCGPLLRALCRTQVCLREGRSLLVQTVAVSATLTYGSGECRQFWKNNNSVLVAVVDQYAATLTGASIEDPRATAELVAQLARLVVNSHSRAAVAPLLRTWESVLDSDGKHYVACSLSNPKNRSRSLDINSPAYEGLRCVFRVDTTAPPQPPLTARHNPTDGLLDQRGRRSASRGCGRGGRGRSRSRGRAHSQKRRRRRGSQQARLQERFRFLVRSTIATTAAEQEESQVQLDALDSTTDSSPDESGDDAEGTPESTSTPQVDLSRWRRGPPPRTIPTRYICSLSHSLIRSAPVLSSTGYLFDEDVIMDYLQYHRVCPISGAPLSRTDLVVDTALKEELCKVHSNFM
ncbi:hypothetical protein LSCM1_04168 [Leishmania martiniquensis]|uniref:U-box domain-containing protein n=1 Tax=Leishmania martiniquensis TaxID=1580590 RepID=A0A836GZ47_9TRYP|nr:hypothetical protein LSCM1_04168 [Leishmania martiniquensis]